MKDWDVCRSSATRSKMEAQMEANDETTVIELQKLLIRHNYQLSYVWLPTATAMGDFSRMSLLRVPLRMHVYIWPSYVIAKFTQNGSHYLR